jgi:type I restriction enzyme M protein
MGLNPLGSDPQQGRFENRPYGKSADIRGHHHVLTPGRYVGAEAIEDDGIAFEEKMAELAGRLYERMRELMELDAVIRRNLEVLGYGE